MMRPLHELKTYDGGRFSCVEHSWERKEIADAPTLARRLIPLLESQDPEDRRDADRLIFLLDRALTCPDGVWVVQSEYLPDADGVRWSDHIVTWSAHLTEAEAQLWHAAWSKKWADRRNGYGMLPVRQENGVGLEYLRHPNADPAIWVPR